LPEQSPYQAEPEGLLSRLGLILVLDTARGLLNLAASLEGPPPNAHILFFFLGGGVTSLLLNAYHAFSRAYSNTHREVREL